MNRTRWGMLALFVFGSASSAVAAQPDLVEKVRRGELQEARVSWWGFDPSDSTAFLQAAINSGVPRLVVDNVGRPWITRPLFGADNQEIVFEKGVVVEAQKGEFKGRNDCLLTIRQKQNVTLRGYGAVLRMHRADYDDATRYRKAEWRHVLSILSSKNIRVYGLTLALSGGDGIYLGVSKRGVTNENVHIKDVVCDRNYRQGISVISARNLLIEDTTMRNTAGTPPMAGIDFEPNHPSAELVNCVLRNCISEGNKGCGYLFVLPNLHSDSAPVSIRLEDCISRGGNSTDFLLNTGNSLSDAARGSIEVVRCRFERSAGPSISIRNKPVGGMSVRFVDCLIDSPAAEKPEVPPISIMSGARSRCSVGGIDLGTLVIIDSVERPFMDFYDWLGGSGADSITGTIILRRNGEERIVRLTPEWWKKTFPPRVTRNIAPFPTQGRTLVPALGRKAHASKRAFAPFFLRGKGTLAVYADAGEAVRLTIAHRQVGTYGGRPAKPEVEGPDGRRLALPAVPFKSDREITFTAWAAGVYRVRFDARANCFGVLKASPPVAVSGEYGPIHFIGAAGEMYFLVPEGVREFGLIFYGQGRGEAVRAAIYAPDGRKVWEKDRITLPVMFAPDTVEARENQIWRVRLSRPTGITCEDNYVDIRGIPPFLGPDPRGLLVPAK